MSKYSDFIAHDGQTLEIDGIDSDGGAFPFTTSGTVTFNQNISTIDPIIAQNAVTKNYVDNAIDFPDGASGFTLFNAADVTKEVQIDLSGITTGNTRTVTFPDSDITLIGSGQNVTLGTIDCGIVTTSGNYVLPSAGWLGLASNKGRLVFTDAATDTVAFMDCNVGIGTSPIAKLHIDEATGANILLHRTIANTSGMLGRIQFGNSNVDNALAGIYAYQDGSTSSGYLSFFTEATGEAIAERMRITSVGNISIVNNLVVDGQVAVGIGIDANTALRGEAPTGQSTIRIGVKGVANSAWTDNYGIQGLAVGGGAAVNNYGVYGHAAFATTLNYHFLASSGAFCTNDWFPPSMREYKSDILEFKDLDINGLYDELDDVKPVKFRYKKIVSSEMNKETGEVLTVREENPDAPHIYGFIADDPDVSDFLRDTDRQSWSPSSASAYALLCIKRQKGIINELTQRLEETEQAFEELRSKVELLKVA